MLPLFALDAREFVVVVDAGHGGARSAPKKDERWDPVSRQFLSYYAPGTSYRRYTEQAIVLGLAKRLKYYLNLTRTESGWREFRAILQAFSGQKDFERIKFKVIMTREDSWRQRNYPATHPEVNAPYRLYDYPNPRKKGDIVPGRISFINSKQPYLVISLHLNPAGKGHKGGMGAVLAPGYQTFNRVRLTDVGNKSNAWFTRSRWNAGWLITDPGWNKWHAARSDAWVYFHGFRKRKNGTIWLTKNRGLRHNLVNWSYRDSNWVAKARKGGPGPYSREYAGFKPTGPFWDRERSKPEQWRREGGLMGYGGDNHLASDELMRFMQQGVRIQVPKYRAKGAMGPILTPFISTYTLPTYVNAITAFLEVGHLNRERDRLMILNHPRAVTRSLAAGIYSLFAGMQPRKGYGPYRPRGKKLDWERYENYEKGNYFEIVKP